MTPTDPIEEAASRLDWPRTEAAQRLVEHLAGRHQMSDETHILILEMESENARLLAIEAAALKVFDTWRDYFDADERADFWRPLVIEMGRLGSVVKGRDLTEPADPEPDRWSRLTVPDPLPPELRRTPKRIQRKRTKGWRMPEGAVYVANG